jgi:hypothetical protein
MNQRTNLNDVKDILELVKIKIERNEQYFLQQKGMTGPSGDNRNDNGPSISAGKLSK